ncbi:MAG: hypothetical protein MJ211_12920 [Bacteroidales bacterium]|nr:hypothetical protein [Bacteroidales bacterium]
MEKTQINFRSKYRRGICGFNNNYITNCYNLGSVVSENTDNDANIGGICGNNIKTITNCYNTGNVSGAADKIGGICGNNINNYYCPRKQLFDL